MPIHDWTRVPAGVYHAFHLGWIAELQKALNAGLLPPGYYALAEAVATDVVPDVLTLQRPGGEASTPDGGDADGGVAVATAPPPVALTQTLRESIALSRLQRHLVIRHASDHRIVALLEIVSLGNKQRRQSFDDFLAKLSAALERGFHLLVVDLYPPGSFDPEGVHGALWGELGGTYGAPADRPLTLAAYAARPAGHPLGAVTCYVEPTAVGRRLLDMPLFLKPERYVNVPLESTYREAFCGLPRDLRSVLEA